MQKSFLLFFAVAIGISLSGQAQKKPLDHSVYDGWETIGSRQLSNDGRFVAFEVNPQEGDGKLVLMRTDKSWSVEVPRGYAAQISNDSRYAVFKIKPTFSETREARIKKKKPDEMPKDSLGYVALGNTDVKKMARIKSFGMPEEGGDWFVYLKEKPLPDTAKKKPAGPPKNPQLDSAKQAIDSLQQIINAIPPKVIKKYVDGDLAFEEDFFFADEKNEGEGSELVWHQLSTGKTISFSNVNEYAVAKKGNALAIEGAKPSKDSLSKPSLFVVNPTTASADTIMQGYSDIANLSFDEAGNQLAFVAERDSSAKALKKYYKLWYWKSGNDSAMLAATKGSSGLRDDMLISNKANINFSKSGRRLFFGVSRNWPDKDTSLPEFERVSVDVWHYNDDYLQPVQLRNLSRELDRSYLSVYYPQSGKVLQLADYNLESVRPTGDGDGKWFIATDDRATRIASQWQGRGAADVYLIDPETGTNKLVKAGADGIPYGTDPKGEKLVWYDNSDQQFHLWNNGKETIPTKGIKVPIYDEENDVPDDPRPHGLMAWEKDGSAFYIYDKYDIWKIDATGNAAPQNITGGKGRAAKMEIRYQDLNRDEQWVETGKPYLFRLFDTKTKKAGMLYHQLGQPFFASGQPDLNAARFSNFVKAKDADVLAYSQETYQQSPDMRVAPISSAVSNPMASGKLYQPNPQQENYWWGTAELVEWKAYDGKMTQGIVYKPENFDPNKKYPMIAYFYETLSDGLYGYQAPAPTPSRLNIPFFVSRGYVVFAPDIHYRVGYPGPSAYDYIVSGARHLVKQGYVDSTKMGLQGQSWGGYQIAYLITQTPLFAAAWAGAPVANMTSAYGGIRWGTGLNRQFQYEKTQSRIGGNLWEKKDLYLQNSPLFYIPKVQTPLVIMHNDEDGAVPWYQGIEMFTAMRRMGKKVWMLNYNGEDHNLVQRKNRKDISIREQQFFDWLLKGEAPAPWLSEGVPATMKGRDLGLGK